MRPIKLTLNTHLDRQWVDVLCIPQSGCCLFFVPYFCYSNVQKILIFVTLFSGTVRPRKFKLGTLVDNVWIYRVYRIQAAAAYLSLYFFIFLSLQLFFFSFCRLLLPFPTPYFSHIVRFYVHFIYKFTEHN